MFKRKTFFGMLLPLLFLWLFYTIMNKTGIIKEHLANSKPPSKVEEELKKTNAKIDALTKKFDDSPFLYCRIVSKIEIFELIS